MFSHSYFDKNHKHGLYNNRRTGISAFEDHHRDSHWESHWPHEQILGVYANLQAMPYGYMQIGTYLILTVELRLAYVWIILVSTNEILQSILVPIFYSELDRQQILFHCRKYTIKSNILTISFTKYWVLIFNRKKISRNYTYFDLFHGS